MLMIIIIILNICNRISKKYHMRMEKKKKKQKHYMYQCQIINIAINIMLNLNEMTIRKTTYE